MPGIPDELLQQIEATQGGDPWYGSSLERLLGDITAAQAQLTPVAGGHSIWEQVLHMTSWRREVTRRILGAPPVPPVEGDWPAGKGSEEEWGEAKKSLARAHRDLVTAIRSQPVSRWAEPVGTTRDPGLGSGLSVLGMVVGLAQHDAYHIGQIAMLRRAAGLL